MEFIRLHQSSILLSLASICFIILLFLLMTTFLSKEKKRALLFFTFATAFMLLSARYSLAYQNQSYDSAYFFARLWKYLIFFNVFNVSYGFNEFLLCLYKENYNEDKTPKVFNVVRIILIIGHILLIISQFTNLYYSYDSMNIYHREKFYAINYAITLLATIIQYSFTLKKFKNTNKRIMIPIILYFILPVIGAIIQLFVQGLTLSNMLIGGVAILLYLFVIYDANIKLKEKEKTEADLRLASEIQQNEIPNKFPNHKEFDLYATMIPAKEVGGDFYDYFLIDENHLGLVIADVSGKGVPAALNMVKVKTLLKGTGIHLNDPAKVLNSVNEGFIDNNKLDLFVTIWFGILEINTGKLVFSNAGHEDMIVYSIEKGFYEYKTKHGVPIGTISDYKYQNYEINLSKGDKIFLYTDGIIDSVNEKNKRYGINNLIKLLNQNKNKNVNELINIIDESLNNYSKDTTQFDDITMLCLELKSNKHLKLSKKYNADLDEIPNIFDYFKEPISNIIGIEKVKKYYVVVDEIFSNIVKYGFSKKDKNNYIKIDLDIDLDNKIIKAIFKDNGIKFNPLEKEDPNVNLKADLRNEGGLGIYIVKKMMDKVSYEYKNGENILTIEKKYY